jgi:hypothetical protein
MILRKRTDGVVEGITQHDHGRMTGVLARAWVGPNRSDAADGDFVTLARLHDAGWTKLDRHPPFDPIAGLPYDFLTLPKRERLDLYAHAAGEAAAFDPWLAVMTSLHYTSLAGLQEDTAFLAAEAARRQRLAPLLPPRLADPLRQAADLRRLQLLDRLSLWLLLSGPDLAAAPPTWLSPEKWPVADGGKPWRAAWRDARSATLYPWPFRGGDLRLELDVRRWTGAPWPSVDAWREADARAQPDRMEFVLRAERRARRQPT